MSNAAFTNAAAAIITERIRQHPKSDDDDGEGENETEVVVIVDESSNPESPPPHGGSGGGGGGSATVSEAETNSSNRNAVRFLVPGSPLMSPAASPQPAAVVAPPSLHLAAADSAQRFPHHPKLLWSSSSSSQQQQHPLTPLSSPRIDPTVPPGFKEHGFNLVGNKYLLLDHLEGSHLQRCINVQTQQEYVCKTVRNDPAGQAMLSSHMRVDGHPHVNPIHEVLVGETSTYLVFPPCHVDLHSYVRTKRRLREPQARTLFRQIVSAVHEAHSKGIVLRDLKLRRFVFTDESRTTLKLESLEDAVVLEDEEHDLLSDKHGCPAYVSPEILRRDAIYSGRAADMWGLGVMLYTMLVGRYPFHGQEHTGLFAKIRRGQFTIPESISSRAKCLIRCLLRKEAEERLTTEDVLVHPWINQHSSSSPSPAAAGGSFSTSLLSASSAASSGHHRSSSERSSRHHRGGGSSSSSAAASTPMSVAPPSVFSSHPNPSPSLHPTLMMRGGAVASSSAFNSAGMVSSSSMTSCEDQTVPDSFTAADDEPASYRT